MFSVNVLAIQGSVLLKLQSTNNIFSEVYGGFEEASC